MSVVTLGVLAVISAGGAPSASGQEPEPLTAGFTGDSTGYQAWPQIVEEVSRSRRMAAILVHNGATFGGALPYVAEAAEADDAPDIWVLSLGHATLDAAPRDQQIRHDLRAMLDVVTRTAVCVRIFEVTEEPTFYAGVNGRARAFNRMARQEAARFDNVEVWHFATWARLAPRGMYIGDGVHNTARGKREMARMVRQATDGCDPATNSGPFWDVRNSDRHAGAIAWVGANNVIRPLANGAFGHLVGSLNVPATRGQVAQALWRRAGRPAGIRPPSWTDVPRRLRAPLSWVDSYNLAEGYRDNTYRPSARPTRAHVTGLLWNAAGRPMVPGPSAWNGVPPSLRRAAAWLARHGGRAAFRSQGFRAGRTVTRAQLAELLAPPGTPPPGPVAAERGVVYPPPEVTIIPPVRGRN